MTFDPIKEKLEAEECEYRQKRKPLGEGPNDVPEYGECEE